MWGVARRVRFSNKWGKTFTKPSMAMMHYGLCFGCGATTHNRRDNECAPSATTKWENSGLAETIAKYEQTEECEQFLEFVKEHGKSKASSGSANSVSGSANSASATASGDS